MGLHTSWPKTHLQNARYGTQPCAVAIQGHTVDVTDRFTYLRSDISSCDRSTPETLKRIGHASSVMGQLTSVWRQSRLSLHTKLRLYNVLVVSVLMYGAETWALTKSDECKLEAFQMSCMRRILGIRWFDFVSNASVMDQVKQRPICSRIRDRRITMYAVYKSLFPRTRHFVWQSTTGVRPDDRLDWKCPRGRPRHTWIRQLEIDVGLTAAAAWDMAGDREVWRAQRPVAGQAVQWVNERVQTTRNYFSRAPSYSQFSIKIRCNGNEGRQGRNLNETVR